MNRMTSSEGYFPHDCLLKIISQFVSNAMIPNLHQITIDCIYLVSRYFLEDGRSSKLIKDQSITVSSGIFVNALAPRIISRYLGAMPLTTFLKVKSSTFNNANLITCFANDYGHEHWIEEAIKAYCLSDDLLILISSSGKSPNVVNAAKHCKDNKINLITLSGFNKDNELNTLGDVNFHVNSNDYNYIEMTHHIILVSIVDIFAKNIL